MNGGDDDDDKRGPPVAVAGAEDVPAEAAGAGAVAVKGGLWFELGAGRE